MSISITSFPIKLRGSRTFEKTYIYKLQCMQMQINKIFMWYRDFVKVSPISCFSEHSQSSVTCLRAGKLVSHFSTKLILPAPSRDHVTCTSFNVIKQQSPGTPALGMFMSDLTPPTHPQKGTLLVLSAGRFTVGPIILQTSYASLSFIP